MSETGSEQRVIQLPFGLSERPSSPPSPNGWHPHATAPRGWHMVFLVDQGGVPSVGQFMRLHRRSAELLTPGRSGTGPRRACDFDMRTFDLSDLKDHYSYLGPRCAGYTGT